MQVHVHLSCIMRKLAYCVCEKKGANQVFTCIYSLKFFLFIFTCKITSNQKIIISWVAASWVSIYFLKQNTHISEISKSFRVCCDLRIFYIINLITVYIVICTAFFAVNAKPKILAKIIANTNELQHIPVYFCIIMRKPPLCIYAKAKGHIIAGWYIRISSASLFSLNR